MEPSRRPGRLCFLLMSTLLVLPVAGQEDPCQTAGPLPDQRNRSQEVTGSGTLCDHVLLQAWYRVDYDLASSCPPGGRCSTFYPAWLSGNLPSEAEGVVTRTVCVRDLTVCCSRTVTVRVKNCGQFRVYDLPPLPPPCPAAYCTGTLLSQTVPSVTSTTATATPSTTTTSATTTAASTATTTSAFVTTTSTSTTITTSTTSITKDTGISSSSPATNTTTSSSLFTSSSAAATNATTPQAVTTSSTTVGTTDAAATSARVTPTNTPASNTASTGSPNTSDATSTSASTLTSSYTSAHSDSATPTAFSTVHTLTDNSTSASGSATRATTAEWESNYFSPTLTPQDNASALTSGTEAAPQTSTPSANSTENRASASTQESGVGQGVILGAALGGIALLASIIAAAVFCGVRCHRRKREERHSKDVEDGYVNLASLEELRRGHLNSTRPAARVVSVKQSPPKLPERDDPAYSTIAEGKKTLSDDGYVELDQLPDCLNVKPGGDHNGGVALDPGPPTTAVTDSVGYTEMQNTARSHEVNQPDTERSTSSRTPPVEQSGNDHGTYLTPVLVEEQQRAGNASKLPPLKDQTLDPTNPSAGKRSAALEEWYKSPPLPQIAKRKLEAGTDRLPDSSGAEREAKTTEGSSTTSADAATASYVECSLVAPEQPCLPAPPGAREEIAVLPKRDNCLGSSAPRPRPKSCV